MNAAGKLELSGIGKRVLSFDIGTGSFGIATRGFKPLNSNEFSVVESLLIPADFASINEARTRRRMMRTRESHRMRELWLRQTFRECGLADAVLEGRKVQPQPDGSWRVTQGDGRLEREFPKAGDQTAYCGAALRVMLLQNKRLEPWQIFKAMHSALQKRGYDDGVPWKRRASRRNGKDEDEGDTQTWARTIVGEIEGMAKDQPPFHFPCYWEAWRMGLWKPEHPDTVALRITHDARSCKHGDAEIEHNTGAQKAKIRVPAVFPRQLVEKELLALCEAAEKQLPALTGRALEILYGPTRTAYASFFPDKRKGHNLVEGKAPDWRGILAQKVPTFDNRAMETCSLIPRFNAAKAAPRFRKVKDTGKFELDRDSLLPAEVTFLMKLKNFSFGTSRGLRRLNGKELGEIFNARRKLAIESAEALMNGTSPPDAGKRKGKQRATSDAATGPEDFESKALQTALDAFALNKTALTKLLKPLDLACFMADQQEIEAPRSSGRSRFSRPSLKIVKALILSGRSANEFRPQALQEFVNGNEDKLKGLIESDLDFLTNAKMGESWEKTYLPNEALGRYHSDAQEKDCGKRDEAIRRLIGSQNNSIIRHRLTVFHGLLKKLRDGDAAMCWPAHGEPDTVALEFVREDFMGPRRLLALRKFQKERREARAQARRDTGATKDSKVALKYQLALDQGAQCAYGVCCKGKNLSQTLDDCDIDHIVPRGRGGPDAYYNFVCACNACNAAKGDQTPWEWLHTSGEWQAYSGRIHQHAQRLRPKKVRLLTEADAHEQVERYQKLAETAWIAKLAQTVVCLFFGWPLNFEGGRRRIVVLPGGLTHRVAERYKLYGLLNQELDELKKDADKGEAKAEDNREKKIRADKRHHALDAMVLSFLPQWAANPTLREKHQLPKEILEQDARKFFKRWLDPLVPRQLCFEKATLEDSIYGARRTTQGEHVATKRMELVKIAYTGINPKFDGGKLQKSAANIYDKIIRDAVQRICGLTKEDKNKRGREAARKAAKVGEKAVRLNKLPKLESDAETSEDRWREFCAQLARGEHPDFRGRCILKVRMICSRGLEEFKEFTPGEGNWRRGGGANPGYFVYREATGSERCAAMAIYVHTSKPDTLNKLRAAFPRAQILGFFRSGDLVQIENEISGIQMPVPAGMYRLATIQNRGTHAVLESANGTSYKPVSISRLIAAGFKHWRHAARS